LIEVVTLLHIIDGRLLMARSRGKNGFYLPGGKTDPGETKIEALRREIREELSAEIAEGSLAPFGHYVEQAFGQPDGVLVSAHAFVGSPWPSRSTQQGWPSCVCNQGPPGIAGEARRGERQAHSRALPISHSFHPSVK